MKTVQLRIPDTLYKKLLKSSTSDRRTIPQQILVFCEKGTENVLLEGERPPGAPNFWEGYNQNPKSTG